MVKHTWYILLYIFLVKKVSWNDIIIIIVQHLYILQIQKH
jgi:hypothetical protein